MAFDAAAVIERAHRGAAAEMGDNHPFGRDVGCDLRQAARDIFVGKAVEAVTPHTFGVEGFRYRVVVGQRAVVAVKRGVEARDLRHIREACQRRADRRQIVGLVQWRQRDEAFQLRYHLLVDPYRPVVIRAAMHDAVPDGNRVDPLIVPQPCSRRGQRRRDVGDGFVLVVAIDQHAAVGRRGAQPRAASDPVHLALDLAPQTAILSDPEHLNLTPTSHATRIVSMTVTPPQRLRNGGGRRHTAPQPRKRPCGRGVNRRAR
jgi:hypothetical protein